MIKRTTYQGTVDTVQQTMYVGDKVKSVKSYGPVLARFEEILARLNSISANMKNVRYTVTSDYTDSESCSKEEAESIGLYEKLLFYVKRYEENLYEIENNISTIQGYTGDIN